MRRLRLMNGAAAGSILLCPAVALGILLCPASPARVQVPTARAAPTSQAEKRLADLDPVTRELIEEISVTKFAGAGEQKEAFDFLWTPGLLLRELLQDKPLVAYPNE